MMVRFSSRRSSLAAVFEAVVLLLIELDISILILANQAILSGS
jgi:hypothetical protein